MSANWCKYTLGFAHRNANTEVRQIFLFPPSGHRRYCSHKCNPRSMFPIDCNTTINSWNLGTTFDFEHIVDFEVMEFFPSVTSWLVLIGRCIFRHHVCYGGMMGSDTPEDHNSSLRMGS